MNRLYQDDVTRGPKGANPDNATSGLPLYLTPDGKAPLWSSVADGNWHHVTFELFTRGDPSGHFGERYWLDGAAIYSDVDRDVSNLAEAPHYGYAEPITHFAVFGNFVTPDRRSSHFTLDFDDWAAWTD